MRNEIESASRLLLVSVLALACVASAQSIPDPSWHSSALPFHVLNVTSTAQFFWICGTEESIAVSSDDGATWQVKNQMDNGPVLLKIQFADSKFGYAAGTGGVILTTVDGGETWVSHTGLSNTVLQLSFSDPQHGIARTRSALLFTSDGGVNWTQVVATKDADELKRFPYVLSLVALDGMHMAVMLKEGAAQYYPQTILFTQDSGQSWNLAGIPSVTLYSFLRAQGRYWAVGTEVVGKDKPGGGHGVPVAPYSTDGQQWSHSTNDLSACRLEMCTVCTTQGCLSANNVISRIFLDQVSYNTFAKNDQLTSKWASTAKSICFVGSLLWCSPLQDSQQAPVEASRPVPSAPMVGPLVANTHQGPQCLVCAFDSIFVDEKLSGRYTVHLALSVGRNGVVITAEAQDAPTSAITTRIEQEAQQWVFEPFTQNGVAVNLNLNTTVNIQVIKSR